MHVKAGARRRRRGFLVLVGVLVVSVLGLDPAAASSSDRRPTGPPDTYVAHWDDVATQAFSASGLTSAEGFLIFGYVSAAVYDSVMAVEGGYEPFAVDADARDGASPQAAVAAAAHRMLVEYLPGQQATILDPALAASLATIPDGQAKTDGVAIGTEVAGLFIGQRAGDGFRAPVTYTPPNPPIPGVWLPTAASPPIGVYVPLMRPFSLDSADQFRPGGPPPLRSRRWARDYIEVQQIGSATAPSTVRSDDQTLAARFWAEAPVQQARGSFRRFVADRQLDIVGAARFMAMVSVTQADAFIACFDAKYHYALWRPITAIRAGDTDGNPATIGDPGWSPLLPATPNHPEYPSAHSCLTPSAARVMARFLGTQRIEVTVPSLTGLGDRYFERVRDLESEVGNARIWGGIHYRTAVEDGIRLGRHVTNHVLDHHFQPTKRR
jgi:hypothetical protein